MPDLEGALWTLRKLPVHHEGRFQRGEGIPFLADQSIFHNRSRRGQGCAGPCRTLNPDLGEDAVHQIANQIEKKCKAPNKGAKKAPGADAFDGRDLGANAFDGCDKHFFETSFNLKQN